MSTLRVDNITNEAGSASPNLPNGLSGNVLTSGTVDTARMPAGSVIQVVHHRTTDQTRFTGVAPIPNGSDVGPTDGVEYTSFSFTPKFADSKLLLQSSTILAGEDQNTHDELALFATYGGNTIIGGAVNHSGFRHWHNSDNTVFVSLNHLFNSWGTGTKPISIRFCTSGIATDVIVVNKRTDQTSFGSAFSNVREVTFTLMEIAG